MKRRVFAFQLISLSLLLAACAMQPIVSPTVTFSPVPAPPPLPSPSPTLRPVTPTTAPSATAQPIVPTRTLTTSAQAAILTKWQSSLHANTYGLGKGSNTYCARCHSPQNWDPASKVDAPPNCVSCKFETDATVRVAQSNRLVAPTEWRNIGCEVCHPVDDGTARAEIAWLNNATGEYEPVADATALCAKCHTDTAVLRHRRDLGKQAHVGFQCTGCHDAHSMQVSCTSAQCHADVLTPKIPGHDAAHASVSCVACHDAGGLPVGRESGKSIWITWRTTELLGLKTTQPYQSHNLQKAADCARCHFVGNPWGLSDSVEKTP